MTTLFTNARILTMNDGEDIFLGYLLVENEKIVYVGKDAPKCKPDRIIKCNGNLLMPGFKNAHAHSAMTFARSIADDLKLQEWLFNCIFPMEGQLAANDQYELSKLAIAEYVRGGITACFDMYYNPEEMMNACIDTGFRSVLLSTVTKYRESVQEMEASYHSINGKNPLVTYRLGYHAEYTCTDEIVTLLSEASHRLKCPIYCHNSETQLEVDECKARHNGLTPTQYAHSLGLYDYGGGGFHCLVLDEKDREIFKKHDCYVVTNPGSNSKLASGIAPINEYFKEGIKVAIGTDGAGSNNALDFFYEMRLLAVTQKLKENDPASLDAKEILKMATVNGAKAMGLDDCDILKEGKFADIIMLDMHAPNMQPINNIVKNIVYAGNISNVLLTMVNGKILYNEGKYFLGEDIEKIYQKSQEITDRLKSICSK